MTDAEWATLSAWVDTLIPPDGDPGAAEAGVPVFIDRQLGRRYSKLHKAYQRALAGMESLARQRYGRGFAEVAAEQRAELARVLEKGQAPAELFGPDGGRAAFAMVLDHTLQGFYGDPRHGGNKEYASWKMLGVPPMPVRGRLHYEVKG